MHEDNKSMERLCAWCKERPATVEAFDDLDDSLPHNPLVCRQCRDSGGADGTVKAD